MIKDVKKLFLKTLIFFILISITIIIIFSSFFKKTSIDLIGLPNNVIVNVMEAFKSFSTYLKDKKSMEEENKSLKKQTEFLKLENQKLSYLKTENDELRNLLELKNFYGFKKTFVAKVVGFSPDNWVNSFIIDLGRNEGIKEGDIVVNRGYLIGIVKLVGDRYSQVMSVNDKNFKITVRTRKTGEICFYNGLDYKRGILKYVRPEQDIRLSDIVETTVVNSGSPEGIPVGIVRKISTKEGEFFRDVEVETFYYPYNLNYVLVVQR
ncbi:rod shape-determining protein MreC [Sulfurihydrogenibium subterraneum]|uniref:rod shape-determining protein MreC n=1 Tax=Sulfurihydrogenibium subterraneum TaxID=171121 RepID=UPI000491848F|nr:rod shape-determining protein MreC [Sulfurihydrogenibium subterraneum]